MLLLSLSLADCPKQKPQHQKFSAQQGHLAFKSSRLGYFLSRSDEILEKSLTKTEFFLLGYQKGVLNAGCFLIWSYLLRLLCAIHGLSSDKEMLWDSEVSWPQEMFGCSVKKHLRRSWFIVFQKHVADVTVMLGAP